MSTANPIIPLGTKTVCGNVSEVGIIEGERYYWMVDKDGTVAMMPSDAVEAQIEHS